MSGRRAQAWVWFDLATVAVWAGNRAGLAVCLLAAAVLIGFGQVQLAGVALLAAAVWEQRRYSRTLAARVARLERVHAR